ncbi:hypothetical protein GCM10010124_31570 [Pilimelia terevasa]|uniref:Uncharacterized protein n=1 Tax=Pilimelia terevasa TaxID=53372 RepID=A0A8J3BUG6_9ACTN|nr:hypothetical protein [Pilimelia terevasa]GGK36586.1 hypothetical protein GCM10010124_31570 [Pilimelia terevasa]
MALSFTFELGRVLELAEHAVAASAHADPIGNEPAGPALLLGCNDGVYLLSNGDPQVPPAADQPPHSTLLAASSNEAPPMSTPGVYPAGGGLSGLYPSLEAAAAAGAVHLDLRISPLPLLTADGGPLLETLRGGAAAEHRRVRMTFDRGGDNPPTITTE